MRTLVERLAEKGESLDGREVVVLFWEEHPAIRALTPDAVNPVNGKSVGPRFIITTVAGHNEHGVQLTYEERIANIPYNAIRGIDATYHNP